MSKKSSSGQFSPAVQVGAAPQLTVHQISDEELLRLASGPTGQLNLNFALALLPAALSILITLNTACFSDRLFYTYCVAFGVTSIQGLFHLLRWWFTAGSLNQLVADIKGRMPTKPGIPEQAVASSVGTGTIELDAPQDVTGS